MVLAGLITVKTLPVAQFPDITPPTVMVMASYPGADAETVAKVIGEPIEQQVNGVENMLYMSSNSSSDGSYSLTITFSNGTDLDEATVKVQNRVAQAQPQASRCRAAARGDGDLPVNQHHSVHRP